MTKLILSLPLAIAASLAISTIGYAKHNADKSDTAGSPSLSKEDQLKLRDHNRMRDHIEKHVKYPATKQELVKACKGMSDAKAGDKKWFEETLPDRTYNSAEEVEKALGWEATPAAKAKGEK